MQTCIHSYTHIQIHSKHIMNLGLPNFSAGDVGAYGYWTSSVGAHNVGAYDADAPNTGAPGVGALDAGAHVVGAHNFGAHGKTPNNLFNNETIQDRPNLIQLCLKKNFQ